MTRISLRKALQKKNVMVGEIKSLRSLIAAKNSSRVDAPEESREDVPALLAELQGKTDKLVALKSAITVANIGVYPFLCKLEELKSELAWWDTVPVRSGKETSRNFGDNTSVSVEYASQISEKDIRANKAYLAKQIEGLVDQVDEYNGTHFVDVEL